MSETKDGFRSGFVLLWGRPNVGKSTLLNAFLGRKLAIVTAKAQTTRNRIAGVRTTETAQMVFVDTPGIHAPRDPLGEYMVATAQEALPDADVVLFVVDASEPPRPADEQGAQLLKGRETPIILVLNKVDLVPVEKLPEHVDPYRQLHDFREGFTVSAKDGDGLDALLKRVEELLPEGPMYFPPDMVTDHPETFLLSELIREQALLKTQQEIPYSLAIVIEEYTPRPNGMIYVRAELIVERDSQKKILIGQGGSMLGEIGKAARAEAEELLGKRFYLDLWVKVREHWRRDETLLARFGYPMPKKPKKRRPKTRTTEQSAEGAPAGT